MYPQLTQRLDEVRRRWRARDLLAGTLLALACTSAAALVLVAADNLGKPAMAGRMFMAVCFWGTALAALVFFVIRRWLTARNDDYFAALVEGRYPELHNRLINALQLGRGDPYGSRRVVEAIVNDATRAAADLDMPGCVDGRRLKRAAIVAGAGLVIVSLYAGMLTPWFANGLARVIRPLADIPAYTATQIVGASVRPGDIRIPEGGGLTFECAVRGVVPAQAQLLRRSPGDGPWVAAAMEADPKGNGVFRVDLAQVTESFDYSLRAGDGRSRVHRVAVLKRPRVRALGVSYQPPAYTGLAARAIDRPDGEIAGLPGGLIALQVAASKPLEEARLAATGQASQTIQLASAEDRSAWKGSLLLWSSEARKGGGEGDVPKVYGPARYQLQLVDTEGYENVDPLWRSILLSRDQAPSVSILTPGRDLHANPEDRVGLTMDARDDYGLHEVRVFFRVNDEPKPRELKRFSHADTRLTHARDTLEWDLAASGLKSGDLVQYWAVAADGNNVTGPGLTESRRFSIYLVTPAVAVAKFEIQMNDFVQVLDELVRLQRENRAQTASGVAFETLVIRQTVIRSTSNRLARAMETAPTPMTTLIGGLYGLYQGLMADAIRLLESGRDTGDAAKAAQARQASLPVQDTIIEELVAMLARLQRNEQARDRLRKIAKTDEAAHEEIAEVLARMMQDLDRMVMEAEDFAGKFEKLPKRVEDAIDGESLDQLEALDAWTRQWGQWAKGSVDELTKLPTGFVDDFGLRPELERIFEEIEQVAQKPRTVKIEVALEDLGASLATEMLEDLEMWMMDAPDVLHWAMEEPLDSRPMDIPEMPLPDVLQDLIGDLLEEAQDIDQEAEDITSAWGDSLNQAGWAVMDGPISNFSAKGVTGNVLPNDIELSGRAGDGRRGKSSGQMVSETTRNLPGRKTPARVSSERYEPGVVKALQSQDPGGATGGGKKAGAGERGLQGASPPDFIKDMHRLSRMYTGLRERATRVANRLQAAGVTSHRLNESIQLLGSVEGDLRDLRYEDASRRRRMALSELRGVTTELDPSLAVQLSRARELPEPLREELLQGAEEGYPEGYESLLSSYYRALSQAEGP